MSKSVIVLFSLLSQWTSSPDSRRRQRAGQRRGRRVDSRREHRRDLDHLRRGRAGVAVSPPRPVSYSTSTTTSPRRFPW